MKQSIDRHKESFNNWVKYIKREEEQINNKIDSISRDKIRIAFYKKQIDEAIKQGKDGFDADRFLVPRKEARNG